MAGHPMIRASFCNCLADPDFRSELKVSKEFVRKHAEILQPTIELRLECAPRRSWKVKTELVGKRCFLTTGWSSFAREVGLKHLETVVFTFIGGSAFNVSVYDVTGCKKLHSHGRVPVIEIDDDDEETMDSDPEEYWNFTKVVKGHHYQCCRMDIPKKFVLTTGIIKRMKVLLLDGEGRKWPVKITDRGREMFNMSSGFKAFMAANHVDVGSVISFKFISSSDNTVEAQVTPPPWLLVDYR